MKRKSRAKKAVNKAGVKAKETAIKMGVGAKKAGVKVKNTAKAVHFRTKRLFRINLANTLTLLNGVAGFLSIIIGIQGRFDLAAILILFGVLLDWMDGKAARFFEEETELGKELDSLSDLITFGVAPAVLVSVIYPSFESYIAGALFVLSAALRLGRFNVQQLKGAFFGLPTTTNGLLLPALILGGAPVFVYPWYMIIMAFLMNLPVKVKKVL